MNADLLRRVIMAVGLDPCTTPLERARPLLAKVAYHEAGHVIAKRALGARLEVQRVTIDAEVLAREGQGSCLGSTRCVPSAVSDAYDHAVRLLGGLIAEGRYTKNDARGLRTPRSRTSEWREARRRLSREPWHGTFSEVVREVEELVEANWSRVTAVAEALLERGTLGEEEINRLIGAEG
jgi:hypothetical protein